MDRGTNAATVLKNQVVPLRLGYIGESAIPLQGLVHELEAADSSCIQTYPETFSECLNSTQRLVTILAWLGQGLHLCNVDFAFTWAN